MQSTAFDKLRSQIERLKQLATQFDKGNLFAKNRYMQAQPSLFDRRVVSTKSLNLADYVIEIEDENVIALPQARWCHPQDIQQKFGVPKPIAKLINQITDQSVY